jgi:hypothetical protein
MLPGVLSSSPLEQPTTHTIANAMAHAFRNPLIPHLDLTS